MSWVDDLLTDLLKAGAVFRQGRRHLLWTLGSARGLLPNNAEESGHKRLNTEAEVRRAITRYQRKVTPRPRPSDLNGLTLKEINQLASVKTAQTTPDLPQASRPEEAEPTLTEYATRAVQDDLQLLTKLTKEEPMPKKKVYRCKLGCQDFVTDHPGRIQGHNITVHGVRGVKGKPFISPTAKTAAAKAGTKALTTTAPVIVDLDGEGVIKAVQMLVYENRELRRQLTAYTEFFESVRKFPENLAKEARLRKLM